MRCKAAARSRFCASATFITRLRSSLPSSSQNGFALCGGFEPTPETLLQPPGIAIWGRWKSGARLHADNANDMINMPPGKYLRIPTSLRSQSNHRIQLRRLACRQIAEDQSRGGGAYECQYRRGNGKDHAHAAVAQNQPGDDSNENSQNSASRAHHRRLDIELQENVAHACTRGHADADLAGAFDHAHEHDVHDADA